MTNVLIADFVHSQGSLKKKAKKFFLSEKPAPVLESVFKGKIIFMILQS